MQDPGTVRVINPLIGGELMAGHAYTLQARMCQNWGYAKLAEHLMKEAAEEAGHAVRLMDRVLWLGGAPDMSHPEVPVDESVPAMMERTAELERKAVADYRKAAVTCLTMGDTESMHLFQELAGDEEGHLHWAETQLRLIKEIGLQNFLTEWM